MLKDWLAACDLCRIAHIRLNGNRRAAYGIDLQNDVVEHILPARGQHDVRTLCGELFSGAATKAA
ncbi:hypothetical protein D3C71_2208230 [compost metagenome]